MAVSRYSTEEKQNFVMAYREATGDLGFLNTEKIARWCNETYMLVEKLHGYDLRRPKEMNDWIKQVNENIKKRSNPTPKPIGVVTASLIDIERIIRRCRSAEQLRGELQKANQRFADVIDANQQLAQELKKEKEIRLSLERDIKIIKDNHDRAVKELNVKERKWKKAMSDMKKRLAEKSRSERTLLQYMTRYISDPIAADHFTNELRLLITHPGQEIVLPEQLRGLANDDRPFGAIVNAFNEWIGSEDDVDCELEFDEEYMEVEDIEAEVVEPAMVMTEGETAALNMLEDL